jgi:hypothetical protein
MNAALLVYDASAGSTQQITQPGAGVGTLSESELGTAFLQRACRSRIYTG